MMYELKTFSANVSSQYPKCLLFFIPCNVSYLLVGEVCRAYLMARAAGDLVEVGLAEMLKSKST